MEQVRDYLRNIFEKDLHAKRLLSLSNTVLGVLQAGILGIHAMGRGMASALRLTDKHAIKQVDRLIGNEDIYLWDIFAAWVPHIIHQMTAIVVNLDWTEFDKNNQSMLNLSLQTTHGRSIPLMWMSVWKTTMKGERNNYEDLLLKRFRELVPQEVKVTVIADRGFGDHKLYAFLQEELKFHFIIRFREGTYVTDKSGRCLKAKEWLLPGRRMRTLHQASVTQEQHLIETVLIIHEKGMKDPWCLVCSDSSLSPTEIKRCYGKRFSCEEMFRDMKDLRYGMGMSWNPIHHPDRRDRMFLCAVLAYFLLLLLGEAGERAGLDRLLKSNTSKKRSLSLFRQGLRWYQLIPTMPIARLKLLLKHFNDIIQEKQVFQLMIDEAIK